MPRNWTPRCVASASDIGLLSHACAQDSPTGNKCVPVGLGEHDPSEIYEMPMPNPIKNVECSQNPVESLGRDKSSNMIYWQGCSGPLDQECVPGQCFGLDQRLANRTVFHVVFTSSEYMGCPSLVSVLSKSSSVNIDLYESMIASMESHDL